MRLFRNNRWMHMLAGPFGYMLVFVLLLFFMYVIFALVSGASTVEVLAEIKDRGTIVIGVTDNVLPYGKIDEESAPQGFEADLATMLGELILGGPGVQFFGVNTKTGRAYLDNGDCDVLIAMVVVNDDNEKDYNLTEPYAQEDVRLLCRTGSAPDLQSADTKIGAILGSDAQTILTAYLKSNDYSATVVDIASYPDAAEALRNGSIHGFCAAYSVLSHYLGSDLTLSPDTVGHLNYAVAVRKSEVDLYNAVKDALKAIKSDGRLNELYIRYTLSAPLN